MHNNRNKDIDLISFKIVENIMESMNNVSKFIRDYEYYGIDYASQKECLSYINDYIKNQIIYGDVSSELFEKVNYLNMYFNFSEHYDYNEYVKIQNLEITKSRLHEIIVNEEFYKKFVFDFENNNSIFNYEQNIYVDNLEKLFKCYKNLNVDIKNKYNVRFENIISSCAATFEIENIEKTKIDDLINKEIIDLISIKVKNNFNNLTKARIIYLELGKMLRYNTDYLDKYILIDEDLTEDITIKNLEEVDLKNNKVICHDWAKIYNILLNKYGIDNQIINEDDHSYVIFKNNGIIIEADATGSYSREEDIKIHDFARIKAGISTAGFNAGNKSKDIEFITDIIDRNNNYDLNEMEIVCENQENKYMTVNENCLTKEGIVKEKIKKIAIICKKSTLDDLEYTKCIKSAMKHSFTKEEEELVSKCTVKIIDSNKIGELIIFNNQSCYEYYIFSKDKSFKIEHNDLQEKLRSNMIIPYSYDVIIPGIIYDEFEDNEEKFMI